ncbi:MAG: sigma-70 family RNA polymerase sigma factor [Planctomycetota bacterium]
MNEPSATQATGADGARASERPSPELPRLEAAGRRVHRYLRCLRCPRDVAPDLVQETLLAALRTWRESAPPLPWLLTTARNLWFARCRNQRRTLSLEQVEALHAQAVRELGDDGGDERVRALRACLAKLPAPARHTLQLYYRDGLTRRQVAERLALSEEGVKSRLERLKKALAACMHTWSDRDA